MVGHRVAERIAVRLHHFSGEIAALITGNLGAGYEKEERGESEDSGGRVRERGEGGARVRRELCIYIYPKLSYV